MASNPPPSGPGQPWPVNPNDTPGTGYQTGGVPQQGQWPPPSPPPAQPSQWAQPAPGQWAPPPQGAPQLQQPPGAPQPQQGQWPPRPPQNQWGQQPQQGQWPPARPAGQQPQQGQWGQQPPQSQWSQQPQPGQWPPQQPQQGQWGQQPQQGQWGQQPQQGQWPPQQPPPNQWAPVAASGWADLDPAGGSMDYPIDVRFTPEGPIGRYWGIPVLGFLIRYLFLIPHLFVLYFVGVIAFLTTLLTWIPVLLTGRYPGWGYTLVGGYMRWGVRVGTWLLLMSGTYPPFTGSPSEGQHVRMLIDQDRPVGRFWGIPILGIAIRAVILIPHFIVLYLLGIVAAILILFAWVPVLIYGRQADLVYRVVGGYVRWAVRVYAYLLLLSGPYPPFRLD